MKLTALAAMGAWMAVSNFDPPGRPRPTMRLREAPKPEKYPGQSRAYLIGANCPEGEAMRKAKEAP